MTEKLLACPLCGGEAELYGVPHIPKGWDFIPRCKTTSCCGRQAKKYSNRETAIAAWNGRADAVPVVRGEWIQHHETTTDNETLPYGWECSLCGRWEMEKQPFCNCGAKMEDKT
jgi:hypothetical protein